MTSRTTETDDKERQLQEMPQLPDATRLQLMTEHARSLERRLIAADAEIDRLLAEIERLKKA